MEQLLIGFAASIMVAVIGFLGIWATIRASRNTAAEQRQQERLVELARDQAKIRDQDLKNFTQQIQEVRANQADTVALVGQLRTENRKLRRYLSLAISEIRDMRATMRLHQWAETPLNAELSEVWFQFETTDQNGEPDEQQP